MIRKLHLGIKIIIIIIVKSTANVYSIFFFFPESLILLQIHLHTILRKEMIRILFFWSFLQVGKSGWGW